MIVENVNDEVKKPEVTVDGEKFDDEILPDADRVAFGLRDTGYDFNTAVADIVDNSITAKATKVDITLSVSPRGNISVYIADNGCGMNMQELRNAMKYGSKEHADKKSLSKFGLGLKTASTAFCRCLSLVSRGSDKKARKIQWDLDYIAQVNRWKPKTMEPSKSDINILDFIAAGGTGTIVIWEKVDRLLAKGLEDYSSKSAIAKAVARKKESLRYHLGVTFQRFLDPSYTQCPDIAISIDMVPVDPADPFCRNEKETLVYLLPKPLMISVDGGKKYPLTLCAYVLPRPADFSTPEARDRAKISVNTEGFYVYRENRLIHYGDWLGLFSNEPHYSLLRVEFGFGAELDSAFNVDIKKSRILPADEILDWIRTGFIAAPRREANDRYRVGTTRKAAGKADGLDAHASSNRNIDITAPKVEGSKMTPTGKDMVELTNENGTFSHKIEIVSGAKKGETRIIPVDDLPYGNLWQPCLVDGKHAVKINRSHPFYQKVYYPVLGQSVMVSGIDALLWALGEAENSTVNEDTEEYYEDMRTSVSKQLKRLLKDLPEPDMKDDDGDAS